MCCRCHRTALLLALAALLLPALAFAERVDLTEYVAPAPLAGDWKAYELDDGAERRLDFISVSPWKKYGWQAVSTVLETGLPVTTAVQAVVPGKKLLFGGIASGDLAVVFSRPQRQMKLRLEPGKIERFKVSGRALYSGQPIGRGRYSGTYQLVGFEAITTPVTSYAMAARVAIAATLLVTASNGNVVEGREQLTYWYAEGLGFVAGEESLSIFVNGALMETVGPREGWLVDGVWRGADIFPQP